MNNSKIRISAAIIALISIFTLVPEDAHAYTDPGTGFMLWQLLVSAFVGLLFYFRKFISLIFRRDREDQRK